MKDGRRSVKDPSPERDGLAKKYRPGNGKRARATPRLAWPRSGFCGNGAVGRQLNDRLGSKACPRDETDASLICLLSVVSGEGNMEGASSPLLPQGSLTGAVSPFCFKTASRKGSLAWSVPVAHDELASACNWSSRPRHAGK